MNINMLLENESGIDMRSGAFCYTLASAALAKSSRTNTKRLATTPLNHVVYLMSYCLPSLMNYKR